MRYLLLTLAFVPAAVQIGTPMICYMDPSIESAVDSQEEKCLATMVYGEARGEPEKGQIAVAHTAMNRSSKKTICEIVLAPKQYSIFNNNPELRKVAQSLVLEPRQKNIIDSAGWAQAQRVAKLVLQGKTVDFSNGATHYIADRVMKIKGYKYPKWSRKYTQVAMIGDHRFFRDNNNQ